MSARIDLTPGVLDRIKANMVGLRMPRALEIVDSIIHQLERGEVSALEAIDTILAEELVDFRRELSALVARSPSGQLAVWPVVASKQRDGICHEVVAPAPDLDPDLAVEAQRAAMRIAG